MNRERWATGWAAWYQYPVLVASIGGSGQAGERGGLGGDGGREVGGGTWH